MTEETFVHKTSTLKDLIPDKWKDQPVLMAAYRVLNPGKQVVDERDHITDYPDTRVIWLIGELNYQKVTDDFDVGEDDAKFKFSINEEPVSKKGAWIIFILSYDSGNEPESMNMLSSYCGLYMAYNGLAGAYKLEFKNIIQPDDKTTHYTSAILNPAMLQKVDLRHEFLSHIATVAKKIHEYEPSVTRRFMLSLHWFEKSMRSHGVDALLNAWIAIEALSLPANETDVGILKKKLAHIYSITETEVENKFCVGRIFRLRAKIVHEGLLFPINHNLLDHIHHLYFDLLLHEAGIAPVLKTTQYLDAKKWDIKSMLQFEKN